MSPDRKLTDLCGGGFAIVPSEAADDERLSDGAYRLYGKLCGHAKASGHCELNVKAYAAARRVTLRTVRNWKRELEETGRLVQFHEGDKTNGLYRVIHDPAERENAKLENAPKPAQRTQAKTTNAARENAVKRAERRATLDTCERQFAHKQD